MPLAPGQRFGAYEVVSQLGAGGMGEVYLAKDSKLKRQVALKVLPADVANDRERLARFQREAEVLASLNHPHIAHVYGIEENALVMELIEGEDLSQRIARGPIPIDEALPIAKQIAEALEAAHEQGIIHRDLKPANVKVRPDGTVKVLDFGLAKAIETGTGSREPGAGNTLANSPTITSPAMTLRGVILGTAAYMSPEQAKGKPVDRRADIWAFGCVLFEMLSAKRAFKGDDVTDIITSVMRDTPAWSALPTRTPAAIRTLLRRCLEKDPSNRTPHMAIARMEIGDAMASTGELVRLPAPARGVSYAAAAGLAIAAMGIAAFGMWMIRRPIEPQPRHVIRASWPIEGASGLRFGIQRQMLALSRNGRVLAVLGSSLRFRQTDQLTWTEIPGTQVVSSVFTSPDGEWIGYVTRDGISKVRVAGGSPVSVMRSNDTANLGALAAAWGDDGRIYYSDRTGIFAVPANGGTPQLVATGVEFTSVHVLPGSRTLLLNRGRLQANSSIVLRAVDGGEDVVLAEGLSPKFVAPDLLLFVRAGTLMGARLDVAGRHLIGEPVALVEGIATFTSAAQFDVSADGTLIYLPDRGDSTGRSTLHLRTRGGTLEPVSSTLGAYSDPRLSPDGKRLALHIFDQDNDIWVFDIARGALSRLTFDPREDETPAWSPEGSRIAFAGSVRGGGTERAVLVRRADSSGGEEVVWSGPNHSHLNDWSPDGRWMLVEVADPQRRSDLFLIDALAKTGRPLIESPFNEAAARFSPDGKWLAYHSDETGRSEVYVRSFPGLEGKIQVSANGGEQPVWSRDGRTLYFRTETDFRSTQISFAGGAVQATAPVTLFADTFMRPQVVHHTTYDVTADGSVLVFNPSPELGSPSTAIIGVFNWLEEVKQKLQ